MPPALVRRTKQHFVTLAGIGVEARGAVSPPSSARLSPSSLLPSPCLSLARARARARARSCSSGTTATYGSRARAPDEWKADDALVDAAAPLAESLQRQRERHAATDTLPAERRAICRCRNAVAALGAAFLPIVPDSIVQVYRASERAGMEPKDAARRRRRRETRSSARCAPRPPPREAGGGAGE